MCAISTTLPQDAIKSFLARLAHEITATLDCFGRGIFKGHLRAISFAQDLEHLMGRRGLKIKDFKRFALTHSEQLVLPAKTVAAKLARPHQYLRRHIRKDDEARRIAAELQIRKGHICIFSELELCPPFKLAWGERTAPHRLHPS